MTTSSWKGVFGDWSDAADWTGGVPNSSSANAIISAAGTYTVQIFAGESFAVASVSMTDTFATLALHRTSSLAVKGAFANSGALLLDIYSFEGGGGSLTIGGALTNDGRVQVGNGATVRLGELTNASGASFSVYGSASHAATLAFSGGAGSFTSNSGAVTLSYVVPLTLNNAFTNNGSIALEGTSALTVTGAFANNGSFDGTSALTVKGAFTNSGTLELGGSLTIGGTLTNNGQVGVGNGGLSATTPVTLGGLVNASGASFSVYGSASHAATLAFSGGAGSFTGNSGAVTLSDVKPLTLNNAFTNSGSFTLEGTSALTVTGAFANSGTLELDTGSYDGGGSLTIGGALTNTGAVQVGNGFQSSATRVTLGGLTNASKTSFTISGSASHAATLTFSGGAGSFTSNSGAVRLSDVAPFTLNNAFANSGSFALYGTSALTVTGAFANSGTLELDIGSGGGGGSVTIGGTLTNSGAKGYVEVGNNGLSAATALTLGGLVNNSGDSFSMTGSASHAAALAFSGGGAGFAGNGGFVTLSHVAPLTLNNAFTNGGSFTLNGTSALTVKGAFANSGTLDLDAGYGDGGGSLTIGGVLTNAGTVQVGNGIQSSATSVTLGGLTNASSASFKMFGSASHPATLTFNGGSFASNGGVFELSDTAPLTLNNAFTNSGSFTLNGTSTLTVKGAFTNSGASSSVALYGTSSLTVKGAFANSGTLDLDAYGGGGSLTIGGTLTNSGYVEVGNSGLSAATALTLGGLVNNSRDSFSMTGSASHAATLAFIGGGAGFVGNGGYVTLSDVTPLTLNNAFANSGSFYLYGTSSLTVTGAFANSGTLELDPNGVGGGSLTIGGTLTNNHTVQVGNSGLSAATALRLGRLTNASGAHFSVYGSASHAAAITVKGPVSNAGTLTVGAHSVFDVAGGHVFTQTAGTTTVYGSFSASTIDVDGGNFVVDTTNFTNIGTLKAAGGDINLSAGGLTNLSAGTLTGGTYEVDAGSTFRLANNAPIVTDDADIILGGAGSTFEDYNASTRTYDTVDATLRTIGASGQMHLLAGRNWTTAGAAIANRGQLELGGGALSATASGASLTNAAGARLYGFGTVNANNFTNSGAIEAFGGTLTLTNSVGGAGGLQIDAGADLVLGATAATSNAATFHGARATLTLDHIGDLSGAIGGFGLDDTIGLVGLTANAATVNGSDQLVVTENGTTVDTLKLSGANSDFYFLTVAVTGGTDIVSLPIPATVADYLAVPSLYDQIVGGFSVADTAANVQAGLAVLAADAHINSIIVTSGGPLKETVATFLADKTALNKVVGGFTIADLSTNVASNLGALEADAAHIDSIRFTNTSPALSVTQPQATADAGILAKIASPYVLNVHDTTNNTWTTTGHGNNLTIHDIPAHDAITGGGSGENFVFKAGFGQAALVDFHNHLGGATHDTVTLAASEFADFASLRGHATQSGTSVLIAAGSDHLALQNMTLIQLTAGDFKFV